MNREVHVRFRERLRGKVPRATRPRWKVFQKIEGKVNNRWYLWLTRSASVVFFWMNPGRGAKVIKEHMTGLDPDVLIIFVCDRYSAYKCWAKNFPLILLAFCWAHVRRDFLDSAKACCCA